MTTLETVQYQELTETQAYTHTDNTDDGTGTMYIGRTATNTGGSRGWVHSALRTETTTSPTSKNFEWTLLGIMNNNSAEGENVGVYGQGNKLAAGPTWAGCFEARDKTGLGSPTSGLVGIEVDVFANGKDRAGSPARLGVDLVVGKGVPEGERCEVGSGFRVGPQDGNTNLAYCRVGFEGRGEFTEAVFDARAAVGAGSALRMKDGQAISWDSANIHYSNQFGGVVVDGNLGVTGKLQFNKKLALVTGDANVTPYSGQTPAGLIDITIDGNTYKLPFYA